MQTNNNRKKSSFESTASEGNTLWPVNSSCDGLLAGRCRQAKEPFRFVLPDVQLRHSSFCSTDPSFVALSPDILSPFSTANVSSSLDEPFRHVRSSCELVHTSPCDNISLTSLGIPF